MLGPLFGDGQAYQPAGMPGKKGNVFRRSHVSGDDEVAFVLAIFVVHHKDHLSLTKIFEYFFNRVDGHWLPQAVGK